VARAIHLRGFPVVLLQDRSIATLRWAMSYAQAVTQGEGCLEGVRAKRTGIMSAAALAYAEEGPLPLVVSSLAEGIAVLAPSVIIDACIKGAERPPRLRGAAELTVGIGPRFQAGEDVDIVIESKWGRGLGSSISTGFADRRPGEPEVIEGHGWRRFALARRSGSVRVRRPIGDTVTRGEWVASIDGEPVHAPLAGVVRGILPNGSLVSCGDKVLEIDPRPSGAQFSGAGKRAEKISQGILAILPGDLGFCS
ncbi:MAG: hypothetical protein MI725_14295, partial [Pirellulales bacterium]|nr:hypothetical protein [Pirellulales bacterium]